MASLATEQDYIDLRDFLGDKKILTTTTLFQKRFSASALFSYKIFLPHAAENIAGIENEVIVKNDLFLATFFLAL